MFIQVGWWGVAENLPENATYRTISSGTGMEADIAKLLPEVRSIRPRGSTSTKAEINT